MPASSMIQGIKDEELLKGKGDSGRKPHRIIPETVWWPVTRTMSRIDGVFKCPLN